MKLPIKTTFVVLLILSIFSISKAHAAVTDIHVVGRIQLSTNGGTVYLRPVGLGAWGGDECPNAMWAYFNDSTPGYDHIVSLAIASKLNSTSVRFTGTCNSTGSYILVNYIWAL